MFRVELAKAVRRWRTWALAVALSNQGKRREAWEVLAEAPRMVPPDDMHASLLVSLQAEFDPGPASVEARRVVLQAMAQVNLKEAPEAWLSALQMVFASKQQDLIREAATAVRSLRLPKKLPTKFSKTLR